jgi:hypothetical protein
MRCAWVVLLEMACQPGTHLAVETVEAVLERFADRYPSALHAPDRCALQFLVDADGPDRALAAGVALWGPAADAVGFPPADLVRAEVKTPAELDAEYDGETGPLVCHVPADERSTAIAYEATRRLARSRSAREASSVLAALVRHLGGAIVPPRPGDARTLDIDLSLGVGPPMVPAADPYSVTRLCLEEILPAAAEDARRIVELLQEAAGTVAVADVEAFEAF